MIGMCIGGGSHTLMLPEPISVLLRACVPALLCHACIKTRVSSLEACALTLCGRAD